MNKITAFPFPAIPTPAPGLIRLRSALIWAREVSPLVDALCVDVLGEFRPLFAETSVIGLQATTITQGHVQVLISQDQQLHVIRSETRDGQPMLQRETRPLPPQLRRQKPQPKGRLQ